VAGVAVKLEFWENGDSDAWIKVHNDLFAQYHAQQPNVSASVTASDEQKVIAATAADTPPDFVRLPSELTENAAKGILLPLDEYLSKWEGRDDFTPGAWAAGQWKGHAYGVVDNFFSQVISYNADILTQRGVQTFPETWDDFTKAGQLFYKAPVGDASGHYFFDTGVHVWAMEAFLVSFGGSVLDPTRTKVTVDDAAGIQALTYVHDLRTRYNVMPPWPDPKGLDQGNGSLVASSSGAWVIAGAKPAWNQRFAAFPHVTDKPRVAIANGGTFEVLKSGRHVPETVDMLTWLISKPIRLKRCQLLQIEPYFQSGFDDPFYKNNPVWQPFLESAKVAIPEPLVPAWSKIGDIFQTDDGAIMGNKQALEDGLHAAAKQMQAALDAPVA
jgi:multiple sugar transport system substrate-binding protein